MLRERYQHDPCPEGSFPPEPNGGTTTTTRRKHGRDELTLTHNKTLRRFPVFHERNLIVLKTLSSAVFSNVCCLLLLLLSSCYQRSPNVGTFKTISRNVTLLTFYWQFMAELNLRKMKTSQNTKHRENIKDFNQCDFTDIAYATVVCILGKLILNCGKFLIFDFIGRNNDWNWH
jgi:hypothetical protein